MKWNVIQGILNIEAFKNFGVIDDEIILFTSFQSLLDMNDLHSGNNSLQQFLQANNCGEEEQDNECSQMVKSTETNVKDNEAGAQVDQPDPDSADMTECQKSDQQFTQNSPGKREDKSDSQYVQPEIPEDAVTPEEIERFNASTRKNTPHRQSTRKPEMHSWRVQSNSTKGRILSHKNIQQPKQDLSTRRGKQSEGENSHALLDSFTRKTFTIAAVLIIGLAASIFFLTQNQKVSDASIETAAIVTHTENSVSTAGTKSSGDNDSFEREKTGQTQRLPAGTTEPVKKRQDNHVENSTVHNESPPKTEDNGSEHTQTYQAKSGKSKDSAESEPVGRAEVQQEILRVDTEDFTLIVERGGSDASHINTERSTITSGDLNGSLRDVPPENVSLQNRSEIVRQSPVKQNIDPNHISLKSANQVLPKSISTEVQTSNSEIVHIVRQGDTLWDISRRYLGNPWRYPELARISHIADPDWIYPGDVVRIRRKQQ